MKTRLSPRLSPADAALLYESFLEDVLDTCQAVSDCQVVPFHSGSPEDLPAEFLTSLSCQPQRGADLGERMHEAFVDLEARGSQASVLVGSDTPTLPLERLQEAFRALDSADVVIGPARDGGYYLIGLRAPCRGLFTGIAWSEPTVLEETLGKSEARDLSVRLLEPWFDVDTGDDLDHLVRELSSDSGGRVAPATRKMLGCLGLLPS